MSRTSCHDFKTSTAWFCGCLLVAWAGVAGLAAAMSPRDALSLDSLEAGRDFRLHFELTQEAEGVVHFGDRAHVPFSKGLVHDITLEHPPGKVPIMWIFKNGALMRGPEDAHELVSSPVRDFPQAAAGMGGDFTAWLEFQSRGDGGLFSGVLPNGGWAGGGKALVIRGGRLVFLTEGKGELVGDGKVDDNKPHRVLLANAGGRISMWLDGKLLGEKPDMAAAAAEASLLKIGAAPNALGGSLGKGNVESLWMWNRALQAHEISALLAGDQRQANTPDFTFRAVSEFRPIRIEVSSPEAKVKESWLQPLAQASHAKLVSQWNQKSLKSGQQIYYTTCVVCHGTQEAPGSLPTARRFATDPLKNGADPYSMFLTMTHGFGQMPPQPQYTTKQKYDVIQYIREEFFKDHQPAAYTPITPEYLVSLPKGRVYAEEEKVDRSPPPYEKMDFGPVMFWTYQIEKGNIVQKGIAIRLDEGPGGVSKGKAWMVYDHDTMRLAAATSGEFMDWRGIAFDGSHGSHAGLTGKRHVVNPVGPGWASPEGSWDDDRLLGRDGKHYGPLPKRWLEYKGIYLNGQRVVISMEVAGTPVLESPSWIEQGASPVFVRDLNVGKAAKPLRMRVAPEKVQVVLVGDGSVEREDGFWVATLPSGAKAKILICDDATAPLSQLGAEHGLVLNLEPLTHGAAGRWPTEVVTESKPGPTQGAFVSDEFPLPMDNPWNSWMRPGGFDFTPDGKAAVVATWNGDVWRVDGVMGPAPAKLHWRRIASGLFQPLGVKCRGNELFVACRDQLVKLVDLNGDQEIDSYECFNNDHQVTEHFHEFAMGLQTDAEGNFYYMKSAGHAIKGIVPQHGALLKISADGSRTEIIANGLRTSNGMCLAPDGTIYVTDQEGHWTPENRINRIKPGGFYGYMLGYSDVTDSSDSAMEQPVMWIEGVMDRSPAELVWVPAGVWGKLSGGLLSLSYGTGRAYLATQENCGGVWQGAMCRLPMPAFSSGIMRGRFAADGALYTCGMVGWASNAAAIGGFYRMRPTDKPAYLPLDVHVRKGGIKLRFSDPLTTAAEGVGTAVMKAWAIKRTENYGSARIGEHPLEVKAMRLSQDGCSLDLDIPDIAPADCYELTVNLHGVDGEPVSRILQGTIHRLADD